MNHQRGAGIRYSTGCGRPARVTDTPGRSLPGVAVDARSVAASGGPDASRQSRPRPITDKLIQAAADIAMVQADGKAGIRLAGVAFREDVSA